MLTEFPHELLRYDPETGKMYWLVSPSNCVEVGGEAGSKNGRGYWYIAVNRKLYRRSRLAFLWAHGRWPVPTVDHINRDRSDDRLANLREADHAFQNVNKPKQRNNTSGHRGVYWRKDANKWWARIQIGNRMHNLGAFESLIEALNARQTAEINFKLARTPMAQSAAK